MLDNAYITDLVEAKLKSMQHGDGDIRRPHVDISLCKEGTRILVVHQPTNPSYPGNCFIYDKRHDTWQLIYHFDVIEEVATAAWSDWEIDGWLNHDKEKFIIKICSILSKGIHATFQFREANGKFKMIERSLKGNSPVCQPA